MGFCLHRSDVAEFIVQIYEGLELFLEGLPVFPSVGRFGRDPGVEVDGDFGEVGEWIEDTIGIAIALFGFWERKNPGELVGLADGVGLGGGYSGKTFNPNASLPSFSLSTAS